MGISTLTSIWRIFDKTVVENTVPPTKVILSVTRWSEVSSTSGSPA
jgi:hypothetical protein